MKKQITIKRDGLSLHGLIDLPEQDEFDLVMRRPVKRERSRPEDEQKISLTFCKDKPSIMPTLFCTKGVEIMIKFDFLNKALDMCILIIRQADMISAGRFF